MKTLESLQRTAIDFFKLIGELITSWYRRDRIRISPTTGRLLGLKPGDRFVLLGTSYRISTRTVLNCEHGKAIDFELIGGQGQCRLQIPLHELPTGDGGELHNGTQRIAVFDEDVAMLLSERYESGLDQEGSETAASAPAEPV